MNYPPLSDQELKKIKNDLQQVQNMLCKIDTAFQMREINEEQRKVWKGVQDGWNLLESQGFDFSQFIAH